MATNPSAPTIAAIYDRVSEDKRGESRSVVQQQEANREAATTNGWTVGEVYGDTASASRFATKERPGYERLLVDLAAGRFGVLVVWESSRGGRELEQWASLLNACRRHGVRVHVTSHRRTYDMASARDWRTLAEDGVDSAYESEKTSQRVRRDQAHAAAEGRPHGKIPYGYQREYDPRSGALLRQVVREDQAAVLREAARRILGGETPNAVVRNFNARAIPTAEGKGVWIRSAIVCMLSKPSIAGLRQYRGQIAGPAAWPAIVEEADWFALQAKINDPARKVGTGVRIPREDSIRHLCSGIVNCFECGGPMWAYSDNGRRAYRCSLGACTGCPADGLDAALRAIVVARLSRPDAAAAFRQTDDGDVREAAAEVARLNAQLDGFVNEAVEGRLTPTTLARIEAKLLPLIADAEARARVAGTPPVLRKLLGAADVAERWDALPLTARREVLRALGEWRMQRAGRRGPHKFDPKRVVPPWIEADVASESR